MFAATRHFVRSAMSAVPASAASSAHLSSSVSDDLSKLEQALQSVSLSETSTPKHLIILDLNGLLLDRRREPFNDVEPDRLYKSGSNKYFVYLRPHARDFVTFLLANFDVAVWSSAMLHNIHPMVDLVFGKRATELAFIWDQKKCTQDGFVTGRGGHKDRKPLFLKELSLVWAANHGTPTTTLLIDDDAYKCTRNPAHTAVHPQTYSADQASSDVALGPDGALRSLLSTLITQPSISDYLSTAKLPAL
jgi:hypothetical protein